MSFNSELREGLSQLPIQRDCCKDAFECGKALTYHNAVCDSCDAYFLRGVFLRCGVMSAPEKRCELVLTFDDDFCFFVQGVLSAHGSDGRIGKRRGKNIIYYKMREQAEDFLTLIGGGKFALVQIEAGVLHQLRRDANRQSNAETANIGRSARACAEQLVAIRTLIDLREFSKLPPDLKEAAEIRLEHPEESLEELRKYFSSPITKSGIKHRFERIALLAESKK